VTSLAGMEERPKTASWSEEETPEEENQVREVVQAGEFAAEGRGSVGEVRAGLGASGNAQEGWND